MVRGINTAMRYIRLSIISAFDGLLFGITVEVLRRIYTPIFLEYYRTVEINEASRLGKPIVSVITDLGDYIEIPLLCSVVFAVVIPIVYPYLVKHYDSSPIVWQMAGFIAATILVILHAQIAPSVHHVSLLSPIWRWIFSLFIISFLNLLFGLAVGRFIQERARGEILK
jgi:hypothetical protein